MSVFTLEEEGVWIEDSLGLKCELRKVGLTSSSGHSKDIRSWLQGTLEVLEKEACNMQSFLAPGACARSLVVACKV